MAEQTPNLFSSNPIIEVYRGESIRKYPRIYIRISVPEMKKIIDANIDFGMSAKEAIESKKVLCRECKQMNMVSYKPQEKNQ